MLFLIGLGLYDLNDITVKGLETVKKCSKVFLDSYTSILRGNSKEELEAFIGKEIIMAYREVVEDDANAIIESARKEDTAFLVVGDPLAATTHSDLILRALSEGIRYQVIYNASIMNAITCCGLQLYSFGETVSICFWDEYCRPESYFDKIEANFSRGLHTLCLLDIKVREPSQRSLLTGKEEFDPPRFMRCHQAAAQLKEIGELRVERGEAVRVTADCLAVGVARVGGGEECVRAMALSDMADPSFGDLGEPLHSMVIVGKVHPLEINFLRHFVPAGIDFDACVGRHKALYCS